MKTNSYVQSYLLFFVFLLILLPVSNLLSQESNKSDEIQNKIDCENQPIFPILKSNDKIFEKGSISIQDFMKLKEVTALSPCLKKEFTVTSFRMVSVIKDRNPTIITVKGKAITPENLKALRSDKTSFKLYFEDITWKENDEIKKESIVFEVK